MPIDVDIVGGDLSTKATVSSAPPVGTEPGLYVRVVSQPAAGAGGGPATIVDGGDVAEGATSDVAVTSDASGTISGKLRGLVKMLADVWDSVNHRLNANITNASIAVTGTFFQTTQPVKLSQSGSDNDVDVLTMPAITGTVTANAGTNLNTSALALEAGGNLAAIKTDLDKLPADPAREGGHLATIDSGLTTLDSDLKSLIGGVTADKPSVFTVMDRLYQLGLKIDANTKAITAALSPQVPVVKRYTTLLHRT